MSTPTASQAKSQAQRRDQMAAWLSSGRACPCIKVARRICARAANAAISIATGDRRPIKPYPGDARELYVAQSNALTSPNIPVQDAQAQECKRQDNTSQHRAGKRFHDHIGALDRRMQKSERQRCSR